MTDAARRPWRNGLAWKLLARPLLLSVPFALFFLVLNGGAIAQFGGYYVVACVFAFFVNVAMLVNGRWVVPRLPTASTGDGAAPNLQLQIASYALASLLASLAAALALHVTIMPQMLSSPRAVLQLLMFALLFTGLFLGLIYAFRFQRRLVDRVRAEAERTAREEHEMKMAADIQQALLPPRSRDGAWYAAAGASIPCRSIGGDFFEYFDLPDGRLGFALADVSGKGPPAAVLAAMVQGVFESHARRGEGPAATLAAVNEAIAAREVEARFATVFYAVLGPEGDLAFSNAGHNYPLLVRGGKVAATLETGGLMLGPFKGARYEQETIRLQPDDVLIVYSDGVTDAEAPDGEPFGDARLLGCFEGVRKETAEEARDRLLGAVRVHVGDRPPFDDVTVMAVRYLGSNAERAKPA